MPLTFSFDKQGNLITEPHAAEPPPPPTFLEDHVRACTPIDELHAREAQGSQIRLAWLACAKEGIEFLEIVFIKKYQPLYNICHNPAAGLYAYTSEAARQAAIDAEMAASAERRRRQQEVEQQERQRREASRNRIMALFLRGEDQEEEPTP